MRYGHMSIQFTHSLHWRCFNAIVQCGSRNMSVGFGNHQNQEPPELLQKAVWAREQQKARSPSGEIVVCVISIYRYAMYASKLPVPIQKLLAVELDAVAERIANRKEVPTGYDEALRCHCQFYRQYLLPCQHIFLLRLR